MRRGEARASENDSAQSAPPRDPAAPLSARLRGLTAVPSRPVLGPVAAELGSQWDQQTLQQGPRVRRRVPGKGHTGWRGGGPGRTCPCPLPSQAVTPLSCDCSSWSQGEPSLPSPLRPFSPQRAFIPSPQAERPERWEPVSEAPRTSRRETDPALGSQAQSQGESPDSSQDPEGGGEMPPGPPTHPKDP